MTEYAIQCPSCQQLINKSSARCPNCGWENTELNKFVLNFQFKNSVWWIIFGNIFFYVLSIVLSYKFTEFGVSSRLSLFSPSPIILKIMGWTDPYEALQGQYWQYLTSLFLHAGFLHILFNMLWLYQLYPQNERILGRAQTFFVYIMSGVAGSVLASLFTNAPVVGASGAIFGLMGSLASTQLNSRFLSDKLAGKRAKHLMIIMLVIGLFIPQVSVFSHLGGAAGGYLLGWLLMRARLKRFQQSLLGIAGLVLAVIAFYYIFSDILTILFI